MNYDEKIAYKYLTLKHLNVCFEPDGNIPPDFSIDRKIGVEVRRLNQQYRSRGKPRGLEEDTIPLRQTIEKELSKHQALANEDRYFLRLAYQRPFSVSDVKKNIDSTVGSFLNDGCKTPSSYQLGRNVTITFIERITGEAGAKYEIGIETDMDSGGWVVPMYVDDITHCISDKQKKVGPYLNRYQSWWLVLVDNIGFAFGDDVNEIAKSISKPSCFEKVILISQSGDKAILEL